MALCGQDEIWMGRASDKPEGVLTVPDVEGGEEQADGITVPVDLDTVVQVLSTGLFTSRGPDRLGHLKAGCRRFRDPFIVHLFGSARLTVPARRAGRYR
jgi:hypothetical protein